MSAAGGVAMGYIHGPICKRSGCPNLGWPGINGYCSVGCEDLHEVENERDEARAENYRLRTLIHTYQLAIIGEDGRDFDARMTTFSALVEAVGP